jgi:hypothetical protein
MGSVPILRQNLLNLSQFNAFTTLNQDLAAFQINANFLDLRQRPNGSVHTRHTVITSHSINLQMEGFHINSPHDVGSLINHPFSQDILSLLARLFNHQGECFYAMTQVNVIAIISALPEVNEISGPVKTWSPHENLVPKHDQSVCLARL